MEHYEIERTLVDVIKILAENNRVCIESLKEIQRLNRELHTAQVAAHTAQSRAEEFRKQLYEDEK